MTKSEFQLRGVDDPRLAIHATSVLPVWLWSVDGSHILWANPVGARLLGAANGAALAARPLGPADPHRRQVAQLSGRLPANAAVRLERLRGFGGRLGALVTCACARLEFPDGGSGVLIVAAEPVGRPMPLIERLMALVQGIDKPIAAFASDGLFVGASDAARALLGFRNLTDAGLDAARADALKSGRSETPIGIGHVVLQRVGSGADVGLVALLAPGTITSPQPKDLPQARSAEKRPPITPPEAISEAAPEPAALTATEPEPTPPSPAEDLVDAPKAETAGPVIDVPAEFTQADAFAPQPEPEHDASEAHEQPASVSESSTAGEPASEPTTDVPVADEPGVAPASAEPSPFIEAVADEPPELAEAPQPAEAPPPIEATPEPTVILAIDPEQQPSRTPEAPQPGRNPLRFVWQMDADGHFSIGSDEFNRLVGPRTTAGFGRRWADIAAAFGIDQEGRIAAAIASRATWSGITVNWPTDIPSLTLPVEMAGLPMQDRDGNFTGYRGFGVCRDLDALAQLAEARRAADQGSGYLPRPLSADAPPAPAPQDRTPEPAASVEVPEPDISAIADGPAGEDTLPATEENQETAAADYSAPLEAVYADQSTQENPDTPVETPRNVLPFRPVSEPKLPSLTPVENSAFNELARQLSARLESETGTETPTLPTPPAPVESEPEPSAAESADWLGTLASPAHGQSGRDRMLLDLLPVGVLIYRLDRLLYANPAFLERMGYGSLATLEEAGGLDALFVEAGVSGTSSTSHNGTPITIAATPAADDQPRVAAAAGRLHTISWDGDSALALIFAGAAEPLASEETAEQAAAAAAMLEDAPSAVGHANAEELGAILDTAAEGILMFDAAGRINSCNRSAEALFGYEGSDLVQRNLIELFAPESQQVVTDYLAAIRDAGVASLLDHGREALGRVRAGGLFPLSMTMGRTRADGPNFFAVFRDLSQARKTETELAQARRLAERAATAKADVLARISHEVRTPLNAILGFAEVMIDERFGRLGNDRYVEYMKDIRASGERVIAIINDLQDLSRIETGKLNLAFASLNLNELVEQCVAVMQPQANRERIIIRTSLAHALPAVVADAQALRQITMNLIGTSIHLANAGGQVIVSTALSDFGEVVLRVRDTGHRLNDDELAAAMQPFRTSAPTDRSPETSGVSLSLTKALVEANRAQFHIKSAPHSGTLIEVVFAHAAATA
ncbi:PAS domain S-box protein [soil metagenome]